MQRRIVDHLAVGDHRRLDRELPAGLLEVAEKQSRISLSRTSYRTTSARTFLTQNWDNDEDEDDSCCQTDRDRKQPKKWTYLKVELKDCHSVMQKLGYKIFSFNKTSSNIHCFYATLTIYYKFTNVNLYFFSQLK